MIWMGRFVRMSGADSAPLNTTAEWLSPEGIVGWIFYVAVAIACFLTLVQWRGGLK